VLDDTDVEVVALSELLNRLPIHPIRPDAERFPDNDPRHLRGVKFGNRWRFKQADVDEWISRRTKRKM
jgi:hypothetical protein